MPVYGREYSSQQILQHGSISPLTYKVLYLQTINTSLYMQEKLRAYDAARLRSAARQHGDARVDVQHASHMAAASPAACSDVSRKGATAANIQSGKAAPPAHAEPHHGDSGDLYDPLCLADWPPLAAARHSALPRLPVRARTNKAHPKQSTNKTRTHSHADAPLPQAPPSTPASSNTRHAQAADELTQPQARCCQASVETSRQATTTAKTVRHVA